MEVRAHDAGLFHALLREVALELRGRFGAVLRGEVGDHHVGLDHGGEVALIGFLQGAVRVVIAEFAEDAEVLVVGDVAARGEDVVRGIVEHDLLGVVDTLGTRHVGEEGRKAELRALHQGREHIPLRTDELGAIKVVFGKNNLHWYSYRYHENQF